MNTELDKTIQCLRDDLRALENKREKACSSWGGLLDWLEDCDRFNELEDAYRALDNAHDDYIDDLDYNIKRVNEEIQRRKDWLQSYHDEIATAACRNLGVMKPAADVFASAWIDSGGRMPVEDAFDRIKVWEQQQNRLVRNESCDEFITFAELAGANQLV